MRSLHSGAMGRIFRYQDYVEEEFESPEEKKQQPGEAFLTFTDDDFRFGKEDEPEEVEEPAEIEEEIIEEKEDEADGIIDIYEQAKSAAVQIRVDAEQEAREIIEKSRQAADKILTEAENKIQDVFIVAKDEGYQAGHKEGYDLGVEEGTKKFLEESKERFSKFFTAVDEACGTFDDKKNEMLEGYLKDLTELALTISEKVVSVSLDSSGEVIKRLILTAAAAAETQQWAKVVISSGDAKLMEADGINIREELDAISGKIELIMLDDAKQGTCLIEFFDQVIDAGADTQLANIKDMINGEDNE